MKTRARRNVRLVYISTTVLRFFYVFGWPGFIAFTPLADHKATPRTYQNSKADCFDPDYGLLRTLSCPIHT